MVDKQRERWYVEQLRSTVEGFPNGEIMAGESPDFVVQSGESSVGIELTVLHLPPPNGKRPHQEQQSLKDRIVRLAFGTRSLSARRYA
jgi:hypothetical protein